MNSDQMKKLIRSPMAMMRYQTTGQLPKGIKPQSPLITLLEAINPADRARIVGVRVGQELGYSGSRQFHTAAQALRWIKPKEEVFDGFPADSWIIRHFQRRLTIDDLAGHCANMPADVIARYPHLRGKRQEVSQPSLPSSNESSGNAPADEQGLQKSRPKP